MAGTQEVSPAEQWAAWMEKREREHLRRIMSERTDLRADGPRTNEIMHAKHLAVFDAAIEQRIHSLPPLT